MSAHNICLHGELRKNLCFFSFLNKNIMWVLIISAHMFSWKNKKTNLDTHLIGSYGLKHAEKFEKKNV